jgi:hypothetical protein
MSLKFSDRPVLNYGGQGSASDIWKRFPQGAQPIASAPERSGSPVIVYEPSGASHWAMHHNGAWQKLSPFKDFRDGSVRWRMDGTSVPNPIAWSPAKRG